MGKSKPHLQTSFWYSFRNETNAAPVEIDIMDVVGGWDSQTTAAAFARDLRAIGKERDINLRICSPGGSLIEGNEIYNLLAEHKGEINVRCGAMCASIATVIAMAGDKVSMAKNGMFMIHNPLGFTIGDSEDHRKQAAIMDKMKSGIINVYQTKTSLSASKISAMMDEETWMTADEALENGFVDEIIEPAADEETFEEAVNRFDMSKFENSARDILSKYEAKKRSKEAGKPSLVLVHGNVIDDPSGSASNLNTTETQPILNMTTTNTAPAPAASAPGAASYSPLDQQAIANEAQRLYQAKLNRDREIDDIVIAIRKRDRKDFSNLAAEFKQADRTPDEFARAIVSSDKFTPFNVTGLNEDGRGAQVVGAGPEIEVVGVRGMPVGTPGEIFVASAEYKAIADRLKGGRKSGGMSAAVQMDHRSFQNVTTSSGLTSIDKQPGVVTLGVRPLMVKDLIAPGTTENTTIRYIQETSFTNAATTVAEGSAKPQANFALNEVDAPVRKIAVYTKVTDELFADYLAVASYINMRLPYMVERTEEDQILGGDGTGQNILGILSTPGIQTQALGGDTRPDALFKAMTKIRFTGFFEPDGFVIHPTDWEKIRLLKDSAGQYLGGGPFTGAYGNGPLIQFESIWGKPVAITPAITAGTALAGAFRLGSQYFQRQGLTIDSTNSDQDDFIKNLMTLRAEVRLALATYRTLAFCQVTGL